MHLKIKNLIKLFATFFYVGYIPFFPGTAGSLCGFFLYIVTRYNRPAYLIITALVTIIGFFVCGQTEKILSKKDPQVIVIDEVCGMLLCYCFLPFTFFNAVAVLVLFRIFDILKPFPIKKIQDLKGSAGVMLDDIFASFYVIVCLKVIAYFKVNL